MKPDFSINMTYKYITLIERKEELLEFAFDAICGLCLLYKLESLYLE